MKILTAAQMRAVDDATIAEGIPSAVLMENAAHRVVECLREIRGDLSRERIVVLCGKGNNGGDGLAIARILHVCHQPRSLAVVLTDPVDTRMLETAGVSPSATITPEMHQATLVIDAVLGIGIRGEPRGKAAEWISAICDGFPQAFVVAVDLPSGMDSDRGDQPWRIARADLTVTFTAPKLAQALPPNCDRCGELRIRPIGTRPDLLNVTGVHWLEPSDFSACLRPRDRASHKGSHGHVLVIGGALGKTGAAHMAGLAALRSGAGLVTVASVHNDGFPPELMWEPLPGSLERKTVVAIGPGLGPSPEAKLLYEQCSLPMVVDADGLNNLAPLEAPATAWRVLTPHPGEMRRLDPAFDFDNKVVAAPAFARRHGVALILKGQRSVIAFADGRVFINPTGTPALAKGGSGDILTGLVAAAVAQFPAEKEAAVLYAVWLHGRAAEHAARLRGERFVLATDLLDHLGKAHEDAVLHR